MKNDVTHVEVERYDKADEQKLTPIPQRGMWSILKSIFFSAEASPLPEPTLPMDLPDLSALARAYECVRFYLLDIEYALSPKGELRALMKVAVRITVLLSFLLLCSAAVLGCLAVVLGVLDVIAGHIQSIAYHLFMAAVWLVALLALAVFAFIFAMALLRRSSSRNTRQ